MSEADDILFSPIAQPMYKIWYVPQSYHTDHVKSMGEFVIKDTPQPVSYDEACRIVVRKAAEGYDVRPYYIRPA